MRTETRSLPLTQMDTTGPQIATFIHQQLSITLLCMYDLQYKFTPSGKTQ